MARDTMLETLSAEHQKVYGLNHSNKKRVALETARAMTDKIRAERRAQAERQLPGAMQETRTFPRENSSLAVKHAAI